MNRNMIQPDNYLRLSLRFLKCVSISAKARAGISLTLLFTVTVFALAQDANITPSALAQQSEWNPHDRRLEKSQAHAQSGSWNHPAGLN